MLKFHWLAPLGMAISGAALLAACGGEDVSITSGSGSGSSSSSASSSSTSSGGGAGGGGQGGAGQGGAGQGGSGGSNAGALKEACGAFGKALCAKINECAPFLITVVYGDIAACEARASLGCEASADAPGVAATPADLKACVAAFPAAACNDALGNNLPDACQLAPGMLKDGAACGDDLQCESTYCKEAMNSSCGTCAPEVQAGAACVENADCAKGLVCPASSKVCTAPGTMGDACDVNKVCQPLLACRGGTCQAPLKLGDACDAQVQQTLPECDVAHGDYCDFLSSKCVKLPTAKAGQDCGVVGASFVLCVAGSTCSASGLMKGTCIAPIADGGACDVANPKCTTPAQCIGGVCAIEDPAACK